VDATLTIDGLLQRQKGFWVRRLAGFAPESWWLRELRTGGEGGRGTERTVLFDAALSQRIVEVGKGSPMLVAAVLVAGLEACLFRYLGEPLVAVATPARRGPDGTVPENLVAVASRFSAAMTFRAALTSVRQSLVEGYANQGCPWREVAAGLGPASEAADAIYGLIVAFDELHGAVPAAAGAVILSLRLEAGRLAGALRFDAGLYDEPRLARFVEHWQRLLANALAAPDAPLASLSLLSAPERRSLLDLGRGAAGESGQAADATALFERQARSAPQAVALRAGGLEWTYAELAERSSRLAGYLSRLGVGCESLVGIRMERGAELIAAVLAVLKAGGAFLPIAVQDPAERVDTILRDSGTGIVISQEALAGGLPAGVRVVRVDADAAEIAAAEPCRASVRPVPGQAAYVIHTSGSTGRPKGVVVTHGGIANLAAQWRLYGTAPGRRVLQFASPSFDSFVCEVLTTLASGGTLCCEEREALTPGPDLAALMRAARISAVTMPPSVLAQVPVSGLPELELLIVAGEDCSADLAERWSPGRRFVNAYGPTETTVCATMGEHRPGAGKPSIGRAIANVQVYVVDACGDLAPEGTTGELWIGGAGVARGYLGQPAQTAERFVPDGFSGAGGARCYRTGDRVRWRADGMLEYLGRGDEQVKIRGYRIEPGEIEAVLRRQPGVREAVVIARQDRPGDKRLVAYVVAAGESEEEWRTALRRRLPDYMVPAAVVRLDRLPLTANGKLDRRALPAPQPQSGGGDRQTPRTPVEQVLAGIWAELLGRERVGRNDHFFDLGGHSLLVTQAVSRIRQALGVGLPLRQLYESPVLKDLARQVERRRGLEVDDGGGTIAAAGPGPWPLSYAQRRLWIVDQLAPADPAFNVCILLRLIGDLEVAALEWSLAGIVRRHEILRTRYVDRDGEPAQVVEPPAPLRLAVEPLAGEEALKRLAREEAARGFDLRRGPLLRLRLARLGSDDHALLLTMHHIATDGWSLGVLVRELGELYEARLQRREPRLQPLALQYKDYASWQRERLSGGRLEPGLRYWRRRLAGLPPLRLGGRGGGAERVESGAEHRFELGPELVQRLQELSRREGVTLFMSLLAGFAILLQRHSGQDDIGVGTDSANRDRPELEDLVGFFVNQLVLRLDLGGDPSVRELLGRVRETAIAAYAFQDTPFEKVVEDLRPERSAGRNPLFQVKLVLQSTPMPELRLGALRVVPVEIERNVAKYDLGLHLYPREGVVSCHLTYSPALFDRGVIETMSDEYQELLGQMAADAETGIRELAAPAAGKGAPAPAPAPAIGRRRPVFSGGLESLVTAAPLAPSLPLPIVVRPAHAEVVLHEWAGASGEWIDELLRRHGALLLRGFQLASLADFERFADAACRELFADYGDLPREALGERIYGSTPYPKEEMILFHNESSHLSRWPLRILFHCVKAAATGGETPLLDCRQIYRVMEPRLRDRFERLGLLYVRNFISGLDVSWQDFFKTGDRQEVERQCRELAIVCSWTPEGDLRTAQRRPAVAVHPATGDKIFFNQIQLHHHACLPERVRADLLALYGDEERLPRSVTYGDGSPIEDAVVHELSALYEREAVAFPWQPGDIVLLDNMAVAHARRPFTGERKIVVAMGNLIGDEAVAR
jgi:amino acid adenylation domain-containing protein